MVDQVYRVSFKITQFLETKQFCSAVFLVVSEAFNRVWHKDLLQKLAATLSAKRCRILHSYLKECTIQVVCELSCTSRGSTGKRTLSYAIPPLHGEHSPFFWKCSANNYFCEWFSHPFRGVTPRQCGGIAPASHRPNDGLGAAVEDFHQ